MLLQNPKTSPFYEPLSWILGVVVLSTLGEPRLFLSFIVRTTFHQCGPHVYSVYTKTLDLISTSLPNESRFEWPCYKLSNSWTTSLPWLRIPRHFGALQVTHICSLHIGTHWYPHIMCSLRNMIFDLIWCFCVESMLISKIGEQT